MNTHTTTMDAEPAALRADQGARVRVWDLPVRIFHWTLAGSFGAAYVLAETERLRQVHVMLGYTVLGLIAFRLLWGLVGTHYARFAQFAYGPGAVLRYLRALAGGRPEHHVGHNPAGSWAIWAILGLGIATGVTGYMTFNEIGGEAAEELHESFANAWLVVVFVHVAGVIVSSLLHRENLVGSMLSGYKRVAAGVAATEVPARRVVGIAAALAVVGFWGLSLIGVGPAAAPPAAGTASSESGEFDSAGDGSRQAAMAEDRDDDDD
jgi:cytochrome b